MNNNTVVITRHPALVDLLHERGIINGEEPVIEHASPDQVQGKHVIGVLPLSLAAQAESVTEVPLSLTPEDRGKELDLERLRQIAGSPRTYVVRSSNPPVTDGPNTGGATMARDIEHLMAKENPEVLQGAREKADEIERLRQQQREALEALEWINHIIETESGAEADSALTALRTYILNSSPVTDGPNVVAAATAQPTIEQLIDILADVGFRAKPGFDEQSVAIGFGARGCAWITPDFVINEGAAVPAALFDAGRGVKDGEQAAIRGALNEAGIYVYVRA